MASAAQDLFNDFEDSGSEQGPDEDEKDDLVANHAYLKSDLNGSMADVELHDDEEESDEDDPYKSQYQDDRRADEQEDEEETKARVEKLQLRGVGDVRSVALLWKQLEPILEKVKAHESASEDQKSKAIGQIEDDPEYKLLTQSNTLSTSIDGEIILVHKFIRDHYSVRFPELETLIQNPLDYAKAVAIIGNGPMNKIREISENADNLAGQSLKRILDGPSLMVVTVEATSTKGVELPEEELINVQRACKMVLDLDNAKKILTNYVTSRMSVFAPNLTTLIGSVTAAQIINYAGGIAGLAKTPACNIAPLGSKKSTSSLGLASNVGVRHQGFLYNNDIIKEVPTEYKKQAMRILAAKIVLAARIDQAHKSPNGMQGLEFYDQVEKGIARLSEVPSNKGARALPAPDDKPARKRGGKRARKAKEANAMTDLRKAQNRMAFGKEEKEVGFGDSVAGLGMIGQSDDGRVRAQQIDQKTRAKLSKKNPGWGGATTQGGGGGTATSTRGFGGANTSRSLQGRGLRAVGVGGSRSTVGKNTGTASTVAFSQTQGMELVDPRVRAEMEKKGKAEEDKWFKGGTFSSIGGTPTTAGTKRDAQGFALPGVPASKKLKSG